MFKSPRVRSILACGPRHAILCFNNFRFQRFLLQEKLITMFVTCFGTIIYRCMKLIHYILLFTIYAYLKLSCVILFYFVYWCCLMFILIIIDSRSGMYWCFPYCGIKYVVFGPHNHILIFLTFCYYMINRKINSTIHMNSIWPIWVYHFSVLWNCFPFEGDL